MELTGKIVAKQLNELLEEVFVRGHGIFLDSGTSLAETLDGIPFEKVGARFHGIPDTIAGHVSHLRFYIRVLMEYITGTRTGPTDWNDSWKIREVTRDEWDALKAGLKADYEAMLRFTGDIAEWKNEDYLGGAIAIVAHCAFHLGIIRQLKDF